MLLYVALINELDHGSQYENSNVISTFLYNFADRQRSQVAEIGWMHKNTCHTINNH